MAVALGLVVVAIIARAALRKPLDDDNDRIHEGDDE
jgi:hypothetical protein